MSNISPHQASDNLRAGARLYVSSLREALPQMNKIVRHGLTETGQWARKNKLTASFTTAAAAGGIAAGFWLLGPHMMAVQSLGFAVSMLSLANQRMKLNRHTRAVGTLLAPFSLTHSFLLGASSTVLMSCFGTARALTFSMMPEDPSWDKTRAKTAFAYAAVGLPAMFIFSYYTSWWGLLNMGAMCGGITADLMKSSLDKSQDQSRYARISRFGANILNLTYDTFHAGSASGAVFGSISLNNMRTVIRKYDVPLTDKKGQPLSIPERTNRYARSLIKGAPLDGLTPDDLETRIHAQGAVTSTIDRRHAPVPR